MLLIKAGLYRASGDDLENGVAMGGGDKISQWGVVWNGKGAPENEPA